MMSTYLCVKCKFDDSDIPLIERDPDFRYYLPEEPFSATHESACGMRFETYTHLDVYAKDFEQIAGLVPHPDFIKLARPLPQTG